jgi:hypothetical protein
VCGSIIEDTDTPRLDIYDFSHNYNLKSKGGDGPHEPPEPFGLSLPGIKASEYVVGYTEGGVYALPVS